ncbi:MAG: alpha/beta hydrolase [Chloroflexi bacterium]|nr:MAG: alpha/beta hydrolase [Chloroflexota bacterium]
MNQVTSQVISKDGTPIVFDRTGDGPPLITVLGATATRAAVAPTPEVAPEVDLGNHFTVYVYDRRGRGDSGDTAPYAVEREIEDLEAVIDAAGGSAFVVGHSSGAVLALRAAGKLGDKIKKLALYEPPFIIDDSRPSLPEDYVDQLRAYIAAGRPADALKYFMRVAVNIPEEYLAEAETWPTWASAVAAAHTISYDGEIMGDTMSGNPAALEQFATIATPTLVMDGSESPPFMHNATETLAKILPNAQHRRLAGQDHGAAPEALNPVLIEFLLGVVHDS